MELRIWLSFHSKRSQYILRVFHLDDILLEIEATKAEPKFGPLLSYLDTSCGFSPNVMNLPENIRDGWIGHTIQ